MAHDEPALEGGPTQRLRLRFAPERVQSGDAEIEVLRVTVFVPALRTIEPGQCFGGAPGCCQPLGNVAGEVLRPAPSLNGRNERIDVTLQVCQLAQPERL